MVPRVLEGVPGGSPAKRGIIYFHYNSIHRSHDDFGHGFHILSVIEHLKAKMLSDG